MADFVAVIRRTVDGLSENSPEMRAKVYEKARSAVRRQLENMKPRPSDDMIDRQMTKLEAAIGEVETDNAEALTEAEAPEAHFEQPPIPYDVSSAEQHAAPVDDAEPVAEAPDVPPVEAASPERPQPDTVPDVPVDEEVTSDAPVAVDEAPAEPEAVYAGPDDGHALEAGPVSTDAATEPTDDDPAGYDPAVYQQPETTPNAISTQDEPDVFVEDTQQVPVEETRPERYDEQGHENEPVAEGGPLDRYETVYEAEPVDGHAEPASVSYAPDSYEYEPVVTVSAPGAGDEIAVGWDDHDADTAHDHAVSVDAAAVEPKEMPAAEWVLPEWQDPEPAPAPPAQTPVAGRQPAWNEAEDDAAILEEFVALARQEERSQNNGDDIQPVPVPVSGGLTPEGEPAHSWALDEADPFRQATTATVPESVEPAISDWSWPVDRSSVSDGEATPPASDDTNAQTGWKDIDTLLGAGALADGAGAAGYAQHGHSTEDLPAPIRPTSYRAEPKKSAFSLKRLGIAAVLLLMLGGGGYAYWSNRDTVDGWISGLIASLNAPPPQSATPSSDASGTSGQDATENTSPASNGSATTDVAALPTKFTQRLQPDGSEIDAGVAPTLTGASAGQEGKSVAAQTEASRPADVADAATPPPSGDTPATGAPIAQAPDTSTVAPLVN